MRSHWRAARLALISGGLAGCFSDRPSTAPDLSAGGSAVAIDNFAFVPPSLTVAAGTIVTWTNKDGVSHTVSADDGSFDSSALGRGQAFQITVGPPGTHTYFCRIHPFMKATLTVTAP